MDNDASLSRTKWWLVTRGYEFSLISLFALSPALLIGYLVLYQDGNLLAESHQFHEVAISISILESAFIAFVTWRCYLTSGERLLLWLTLGFAGFSAIYAPHGMFTRMSHEHMPLFLIYGPISRLFMGLCLLVGLLQYGKPAHGPGQRPTRQQWLIWLLMFALLDVAAGTFAVSPLGGLPYVKQSIEGMALIVLIMALVLLLRARYRSPLMQIYTVATVYFALSSISFLLARPWNHQWWLGHAIFAAGFLLLSYGVIRAFHTTRSFSDSYSQEEWVERLAEAKNRAEGALEKLQDAHAELENIAITDSLTGIFNRRHFLSQAELEITRAQRQQTALATLLMDIDHFKQTNDSFGHAAGDVVLSRFAECVKGILRSGALFGRLGGEEFAVILPDTSLEQACLVAERIRSAVSSICVSFQEHELRLTVSIGVAVMGRDGQTTMALLSVADSRLYAAKHLGRNQVVSELLTPIGQAVTKSS